MMTSRGNHIIIIIIILFQIVKEWNGIMRKWWQTLNCVGWHQNSQCVEELVDCTTNFLIFFNIILMNVYNFFVLADVKYWLRPRQCVRKSFNGDFLGLFGGMRFTFARAKYEPNFHNTTPLTQPYDIDFDTSFFQ